MTEGNIANWRVKEGDSYSAGDVILEIETDKATMDVEAQDEGILFKITQPDGSKGVKVGSRIAVMAEEGDDLSSLEMPAEDTQASSSSGKEEKKTEERKTDSASPKAEASAQGGSKTIDAKSAEPSTMQKPYAESPPKAPTSNKSYAYPLYPSVQSLLHSNGFSDADAAKIPASGPNGRLLKGDVLAFLGQITNDYPQELSKKLDKLTHLDLTYTAAAKPTQPAQDPKSAPSQAAEPDLPIETEIAVPISLSAVLATQKRVQDSLGIFLPLSTFIARASELANEDLPARKNRKPTADELFNSVLGLNKPGLPRVSRGNFFPSIIGIPPPAPAVSASSRSRAKKDDIIDVLASKKQDVSRKQAAQALGISAGDNVFSVTVGNGEEERATEYLERVKMALEKEPGRLVL